MAILNELALVYARRGGVLVHVDAVSSGLACGCICPACDGLLVAKKGGRNRHHFAHHHATPCPGAAETGLHLAAKAVLMRRREVVLPGVCLGPGYAAGPRHAPARRYALDHVRTEVRLGEITPDLVAWVRGRDLYIEVCVTHRVDADKRARIAARGVSTVEIDLGGADRGLAPAEIERRVVDAVDGKHWVYNASAEAAGRALVPGSRLIPTRRVGGRDQVDYCPIHARRWGDKAPADVARDCAACPQCLSLAAPTHVRCLGHLRGLNPCAPGVVREGCRAGYAVLPVVGDAA